MVLSSVKLGSEFSLGVALVNFKSKVKSFGFPFFWFFSFLGVGRRAATKIDFPLIQIKLIELWLQKHLILTPCKSHMPGNTWASM